MVNTDGSDGDAIVALIAKHRLTVIPDEDEGLWYAGVFSYAYFSAWEKYLKLDGNVEPVGFGRTIAEAVKAAAALIEASTP
jgi:hypothetical protein